MRPLPSTGSGCPRHSSSTRWPSTWCRRSSRSPSRSPFISTRPNIELQSRLRRFTTVSGTCSWPTPTSTSTASPRRWPRTTTTLPKAVSSNTINVLSDRFVYLESQINTNFKTTCTPRLTFYYSFNVYIISICQCAEGSFKNDVTTSWACLSLCDDPLVVKGCDQIKSFSTHLFPIKNPGFVNMKFYVFLQ